MEKNSDKILTDAKAAATNAVTFGMETGQAPVDDAHTLANAAFNTGATGTTADLEQGHP